MHEYKYSGYGFGFDSKGTFTFPVGDFACSVTIFVGDMSSSLHVNNKKRDILILEEGPTQGLDGRKLTAEKKYLINFTKPRKKFCLSLHCNGTSSYLFVNGTGVIKPKAEDTQIVITPLCLEKISKDFTADNMKKTELCGYIYDFSVDYNSIAVADILDFHKY